MIYGYPEVGRYGLAHSLLAWARCEVWCKENEIPIIAPSWRYLRIGPYLRGERDKRQYHRYFRFPKYVCGLRRQYLLKRLPHVVSSEYEDQRKKPNQNAIIVFENLLSMNEETHFHRIIGHHEHIRNALFAITKTKYRPNRMESPHVALHVRMGDFSPATAEELRKGVKNARIPVEWYREMLIGVRNRLGIDCRAVIYSDGDDEQLRPILALPQTKRALRQPAITDLLSMGNAVLLISSGSGFSCWGAYLGQVPRICFPNQRLFRTRPSGEVCDFEPECDSATDIDEVVLATAKTGLNT